MSAAPTPAEFRSLIKIETDHGPRLLTDVLDPWQRADFEALDQAWMRVAGRGTGGYSGAWLERPRGHSKTSDLAVQVAWALTCTDRPIEGIAAAGDREQAGLLRNGIDKLIRANDFLAELLDCQTEKVICKRTGSELKILSSDAPTSYGENPNFLILDEVTTWGKRDLWDSIDSASAKRPTSLEVIITNAGFKDTWQWDAREQIRHDEDWYFNALDGVQASWITEKQLGKQKKRRPPAVFRRLFLNIWADGAGDALDRDDIVAAIRPELSELLGPEPGWTYVAGGDLGVTRDASAIVVLGIHTGGYECRPKPKPPRSAIDEALADLDDTEFCSEDDFEEIHQPGTGRIKLAAVRIFKPPAGGRVSLEQVESEIANLSRRFNLAAVGLDPYQAAQMIERLRRQNLPVEQVNQVGKSLQVQATAVLAAFRERRIELYQHPDLIADLKALRVVEKQYGFRLEAPTTTSNEEAGTRHADSATALSIALTLAGSNSAYPSITTVDDLIVM